MKGTLNDMDGIAPADTESHGCGHVDEDIRRDVTDAIFDLRMPPGTRLSEASLGELYHVSRTVARKALFHLVRDNLVEMRPQRGAIVAQPTARDAREVFEARRIVEAALLERSVPTMTATGLRKLRELAANGADAYANHDRRRMIRTSGEFHRELAAMAGNGVLYRFLVRLIGRTSLVIASFPSRTAAACVPDDHATLIGVIERGDVARAKKIMQRHLVDCEGQLDLSDAPPDNELAHMLAIDRNDD